MIASDTIHIVWPPQDQRWGINGGDLTKHPFFHAKLERKGKLENNAVLNAGYDVYVLREVDSKSDIMSGCVVVRTRGDGKPWACHFEIEFHGVEGGATLRDHTFDGEVRGCLEAFARENLTAKVKR